jgi:hypothetical protein
MSLYLVTGMVAGQEVMRRVEANTGSEALYTVVKPYVPTFKGTGEAWPKARQQWFEKNVRLNVTQIAGT